MLVSRHASAVSGGEASSAVEGARSPSLTLLTRLTLLPQALLCGLDLRSAGPAAHGLVVRESNRPTNQGRFCLECGLAGVGS